MHPLLAASLLNSFSSERVAAAKTRRVAKAAAKASVADDAPAEVIIRRASATDAPALVRLGALDSDHQAGRRLAASADEQRVLVAEIDGEIEAALDVDRGVSVADPFRPSAVHAELLALRARQLGAAPRDRHVRSRVLHPRTS